MIRRLPMSKHTATVGRKNTFLTGRDPQQNQAQRSDGKEKRDKGRAERDEDKANYRSEQTEFNAMQ